MIAVKPAITARRVRPWQPGRGLLVAALLLCVFEAYLHTDAFLVRFRSVFAAGRAMDKVAYVQAERPALLILGNSRADNAFDPNTVARALPGIFPRGAFNLGLPGADMRVLAGIVERLDRARALGPDGVRAVVLSLDESLVQPVDTLGQEVFFASVPQMLADRQFHDALRASLRLYGYTDNLRQLREPAVLGRFVDALHRDIDPVGGGAALHRGYRAGVGALQDEQAARRQEAGSLDPPSPVNVRHLWRLLDLLAERGVVVAVVFPPLLNRDVLYRPSALPQAAPYAEIAAELRRRSIPLLALDGGPPRLASEFVNAGHLNDRGAQRYSLLLGQALASLWNRADAAAAVAGPPGKTP